MSETDQKLYQMLRALDKRVGKLETLEQYIPPGGNFVPRSNYIAALSGASPSATNTFANSWTMAALGLPSGTKGLAVRIGAKWAAASDSSYMALSHNNADIAVLCRASSTFYQDRHGIVPITSGTLYAGFWGVSPSSTSVYILIFGYWL